MPAPLHIILTEAEDLTLQELSVPDQGHRIKLRAIALNADGWNVPQMSAVHGYVE